MARFIKSLLFGAIALVLDSNVALASTPSLSWEWQLSAESQSHEPSSLLPDVEARTASQSDSLNGLLDLEARWGKWSGLFALQLDNLYNVDGTDLAQESIESEFILQELYLNGELNLGGVGLDYLLGKVRLDPGVGYGYRPLDIFRPYRQNPIGIVVEEGAGVASLSYFDSSNWGMGEHSLIITDSSWTQQSGTALENILEQQGLGYKRYAMAGNKELQLLAYYDNVREGLIGGSLVSVVTPSLEFHTSATWQRLYLAYEIPETEFEPVVLVEKEGAAQVLTGFSWTADKGHHVIGEYWFDGRAWSDAQWQDARERVESLSSTNYTQSLALSYGQGLTHSNLVQHNLLLHGQLDTRNLDTSLVFIKDITPSVDLMYSPSDSGLIATNWISYVIKDSGYSSLEAEVAARFFTGDSASVYSNLSNKYMIIFNLKGRF